jgi:DNA-binding HxlR family transcriptional regulator
MNMSQPDKPVIEKREGCIKQTLEVMGNKWTGLIIRDLTTGKKRFGELQREIVGISPRTLSQRLDDLEEVGIIEKEIFAEVPPRVEYQLTQKGTDLIPILQQMADWGYKHHHAT